MAVRRGEATRLFGVLCGTQTDEETTIFCGEVCVAKSDRREDDTKLCGEFCVAESQTRRKHKILWSVLCSEDEILRDKDNELKILWRVLCGRTRLTRRQTFWAEFCVTETGEENTQDSLESFCGPKSWRFLCMLKRNR